MKDVVGRYVELLCHEINNPLTIVYGQAAVLKTQLDRESLDRGLARERLTRIDDNTVRVVGLVRELREAFRDVEHETQEIMSLTDALNQARVFTERLCRTSGATLTFAPSTAGPLVCVGPVRLRGILWRVMIRALQLCPRVEVRAELGTSHLSVVIAAETPAPGPEANRCLPKIERLLKEDRVELLPWAAGAETGLELRFPRVD